MKTQTDVDFETIVSVPPMCDVKWYNEKDNKVTECTNIAIWEADCHEEFALHDYAHINLCGECVLIAKLKYVCRDLKSGCGKPLLMNLRKL